MVSTSYRRLQVEVAANVGGFTAGMNRVMRSTSQVGQGFRNNSREASLFSNQIRAIGTVARYALAGQLIFGIQASLVKLRDFKAELGQINALAAQVDQQGHLTGLGSQLDTVGTQAVLMSNKFGVAVGDVEQYMQRFFSSFNPPGTAKQKVKEMETYTKAMLQLHTALGTEAGDPQKLAGGLTGLINALPGGRANPGKSAAEIADMFAVVLRGTPSLTGADIATAAGRFASAKTLSGMSVQQIMATFGVASQTGGSPAVIIRGLTQLLGQSLLHPTRPQSKQTYLAAGLPTDPNLLHQMGGEAVLEKLIKFVQAGKVPGKKGNINLDAIYNAFSRQESVRQFVNLLANGGVPALKAFNKQLSEGVRVHTAAQMSTIRLRQSILQRGSIAGQNLGMNLIRGAQMPLEMVAQGEIGLSNLVARHQTATQVVEGGLLSAAVANSLRKMGAFSKLGGKLGRFGRVGRFLGGISNIEGAAVGTAITAEQMPHVMAGTATDGTRANPFWVIISPLSWAVGTPGGDLSKQPSSPGGAKKTLEDLAKKVGPSAAIPAGTAIAGGGFLAGDAALAATGIGAPLAALGLAAYLGNKYGGKGPAQNAIQKVIDKNNQLPMPGSIMPGLGSATLFKDGKLTADFGITLKNPDGTKSKQILRNIPVKITSFPTKQGKPGSRKGGR